MANKKPSFELLVRAEYETKARYEAADAAYREARKARTTAENLIEREYDVLYGPGEDCSDD